MDSVSTCTEVRAQGLFSVCLLGLGVRGRAVLRGRKPDFKAGCGGFFQGGHKVRLPVTHRDSRLLRVNTKIPSDPATPFCLPPPPIKKPDQTSSNILFFETPLSVPIACACVFWTLSFSQTTKKLQPGVTWKTFFGGESVETYKS